MKPLRSALPDIPDLLWLRLASTLALALLVAVAATGGVFRPFEHRLEELTFALFERPASGQVHIVEMGCGSRHHGWHHRLRGLSHAAHGEDAARLRSPRCDPRLCLVGRHARDAC